MKTLQKITFVSPIGIDNGFTSTDAGKHQSTMQLFDYEDNINYFIEWIVEDLDIIQIIGIFCYDENKVIHEYDGIFELPKEAVKLLHDNGFDTSGLILD